MRRRRALGTLVGVAVVLVVALVLLLRLLSPPPPATVRVVAVGDMACDPADPSYADGAGAAGQCRQRAVSDLAVSLAPDALLGLGDYQYEVPSQDAYRQVYDPTWGRLREVTIPALGNQEYKVHEANTFYGYFGERAGPPGGYWATTVGAWQVLVLNSNCTVVVGGCAAGSPQERWLRATLDASTARCTLAVWHHPRWSTGIAGPDPRTGALYAALADHEVELLLSGHEAQYERFEPLDATGRADEGAVRQIVVGTGGQAVYDPAAGDARWRSQADGPPSAARDVTHHGVLELTLRPSGYAWRFHALDAGVSDLGSASCR